MPSKSTPADCTLAPSWAISSEHGPGRAITIFSRELARRLGHQFKGEGAGYGFPEITQTGTAVELAAIADDADEIRNQILALSVYLHRVEIVV
jgi:hypothetical protein